MNTALFSISYMLRTKQISPSKTHVDLIEFTFKYVRKHKTFRPIEILLPFYLDITYITEKNVKGTYNQVS